MFYKVSKSLEIGRFLSATQDIRPGDKIFLDFPAVIGPDYNSYPSCLGCHKRIIGTYTCKYCKWPMCSEKCSRSNQHNKECKVFFESRCIINISDFNQPCKIYDIVFPLRVMLLKNYNIQLYEEICKLMDHEEIHQDEATRLNRIFITEFLIKKCKLYNNFSITEIHKLLGILSINSFIIQEFDEDGSQNLVGIYPITSLISHSCIPNTKIITNDDFSFICEALTPIKKDQMLVFNYHHYIYHLYGTKYRRSDLKYTWSFDCSCSLCSDPTECQTYISALNCTVCKIGKVIPNSPLDSQSEWSCNSCSSSYSAENIDSKVKKIEKQMEKASGKPNEMEKLLHRMYYTLGENHYFILEIKRQLIEIYGREKYPMKNISIELLNRKIDYCNHLLEIISIIFPGQSEIKGYILSEKCGAQYKLLKYKWLRMKINEKNYYKDLKLLKSDLEETVQIFDRIKSSLSEGKICNAAKIELANVSVDMNNFLNTFVH